MENTLTKIEVVSDLYVRVRKGQKGTFHQFCSRGNYEDGIQPCAIIIFENGQCESIEVGDFKFIK